MSPVIIAGAAIAALGWTAVAAGAADASAADTPPAAADAVSEPSGADALAAALSDGLVRWFPPTGPGVRYQWDGTLAVAEAGEGYTATLPALTAIEPDGSRTEIGVLTLGLVPTGTGNTEVALIVPGTVAMVAADGSPVADVTVDERSVTGLWVGAIETLVRLDAEFGGVSVVSHLDASAVRLDRLTITTALEEGPSGRWSGPTRVALDGLAMTDAAGKPALSVGIAAIDAVVQGLDLARTAVLEETVKALPSDSVIGTRRWLATVQGLVDGAEGTLTIADLSTVTPEDGSVTSIARAELGLGLRALNDGRGTLELRYLNDGFTVTPPPATQTFTPEHASLRLSAVGLPNADLWRAIETWTTSAVTAGPAAGLMFGRQIAAALSAAGSRLVFESVRFASPDLTAEMAGAAKFDMAAPLGATAKFDLTVQGIDAAIAALEPKPGQPLDDSTQTTLALIGMLEALGIPGTDAEGRATRSFQIEADRKGRLTLNGADLSLLLGGIQAR